MSDKKVIQAEITIANSKGGISAAFAIANRHKLPYQYCPGCETETPIFPGNNDCLICGQETVKQNIVPLHTEGTITALARSIPRHSLVKFEDTIYMIETNIKGRKVLLIPKEGQGKPGREIADDVKMEIYKYPAQCASMVLNSIP